VTANLAFIGFGVVGQGLAEILIDKKEELEEKHDFTFRVVAICDTLKGSINNPDGIDLKAALDAVNEGKKLDDAGLAGETGWDAIRTIHESNADLVLEATYTDIKTGEPATSHFLAALESGKDLATTNKGPVALHFRDLNGLASAKGLHFRFEGTVMSGTPVLNLCSETLAGCEIKSIRGILNGTTNYILSEMEKGMSYEDALKQAQELGYAEAVPDADVLGWDAMAKVIILSNTLMDAHLSTDDIDCTGITEISLEEVNAAVAEGFRWKLIGSVTREGDKVTGRVAPEKIPLSDPLAAVMGPTNALTFDTDLLGPVTIQGAGAGRLETGFSLLTDILAIHRMR